MNKSLEIYYDTEADILEINIGEPSSCIFDEVADGVFEANDETTKELKGYKIFDFSQRSMKNIRIPLPVNVDIKKNSE